MYICGDLHIINMIQPDKIDLAYIIDDDPTTIELVRLNNERFGFCDTLESFTDPYEAVKTLTIALQNHTNIPQMILLDINMPVMDAWDFLDRMNDVLLEANVSVFILSSSINPKDMDKSATYSSVLKYVMKPLGLDKIATILGLIKKSGRLGNIYN